MPFLSTIHNFINSNSISISICYTIIKILKYFVHDDTSHLYEMKIIRTNMKQIEKRIARILENLIEFSAVEVTKFLNDFNVSKSALRRDFKRVAKYIAYEDVVQNAYGIDSAISLKLYIHDIKRTSSIIANDNDPTNQIYLENLFSQINKLPKRSDLKYKEIEKFREFEMTYSIVNEMAIRNKRVAKLIKVFHKLASSQDKKSEKFSNYSFIFRANQNPSDDMQKKYNTYHCNIHSKKETIEKIFNILKNDYMVSPLECKIDGVDYNPNNDTYVTLMDFNIDCEDTQSMINGELRLNTNLFDMTKQVNSDNLSTYVLKENDGFILEQKKYNKSSEFKYSIIKPSFSRNIIDNNVTTLSINFSLPKEEILAYISHIKKSLYPYEQDKRIKTPEELTSDQIYLSSFTKLKKSDIANYFFIYDFVKKRAQQLKYIYLQKKQEEDDIVYLKDIELEHKESIFKEEFLQKQTKLDEKSIKRYYYTMYHFIDKLEYRELVNSAFYKPKVDDLRLLSTQEQQAVRKQVIEGFEQNLAIEKISHLTGMSKSRIYALKTQYHKDIGNALTIKKRGRATASKKLSEELDKQIVIKLLENDKLWDKDSVRAMLNEKLDRQLSISSIVNYLKSKQISFENKIEHPMKQMTIKEWIEFSFPNIRDEAKINNAIICWSDAFCKQKIDKDIYLTKLVIYPRTKFMFRLDSENDIDSFINLLTKLITHFNQMIYLIADSFNNNSLQAGEKTKISNFLLKNSKKIKLYK